MYGINFIYDSFKIVNFHCELAKFTVTETLINLNPAVSFCSYFILFYFFIFLWSVKLNNSKRIFIILNPKVFLGKGVLKIGSKFTEEHPCQIEIALRHRCSSVNEHLFLGAPLGGWFWHKNMDILIFKYALILRITRI